MGSVARWTPHGDVKVLENMLITATSKPVFPGTADIGSALPESPWQPSDLQKVCRLCGLFCMFCGEGHSSLGPSLRWEGRMLRLLHTQGPSGETSHAVPFTSTPASWTRGNNCLQSSTPLTRKACLPCPWGWRASSRLFLLEAATLETR